MQLKLGFLADFANKSAEGKLNILGVFDRIWAPRYPATHQEMKLVLGFEIHPAEVGQTKKIQIQLCNQEGVQLFELSGDMGLRKEPPPGTPAGQMINLDQILGINRLSIPSVGRYEFVILVNGEIRSPSEFRPSEAPGAHAGVEARLGLRRPRSALSRIRIRLPRSRQASGLLAS